MDVGDKRERSGCRRSEGRAQRAPSCSSGIAMSGWTLEAEDRPVGSDNNRKSDARVAPRKVFFPDDGDDDAVRTSAVDARRDSLTIASTRTVGRRSQRGRAELVVNDGSDDESSTLVHQQCTKETTPRSSSSSPPLSTSSSSKADEVGRAETVQRVTEMDSYVHSLVREFLVKRYTPEVVATLDKELPALATAQPIEELHARIVSDSDAAKWGATRLEQVVAAWDTRTHRRRVIAPSSKSTTAAAPSSSSSKPAKGLSKKPQLRVSVATEAQKVEESDEVDYNRLNHPGHTPKAQASEVLAAVIGRPGSTPRASASELRALGFDDIDDQATTAGPTSLLRVRHVESDGGEDAAIGAEDDDDDDDDDGDGLSDYARRKRAAGRHHKHVYIGDAGHTPTKEYIFFRETPPRFVAESIEDAEDALRAHGGSPGYTAVVAPARTMMERFVELQSSDVAKYSVGLRVENLGSQRNVTGVVSKIYGSRQCGAAGPGTIVIDTWDGSDEEPSTECAADDDDF